MYNIPLETKQKLKSNCYIIQRKKYDSLLVWLYASAIRNICTAQVLLVQINRKTSIEQIQN